MIPKVYSCGKNIVQYSTWSTDNQLLDGTWRYDGAEEELWFTAFANWGDYSTTGLSERRWLACTKALWNVVVFRVTKKPYSKLDWW